MGLTLMRARCGVYTFESCIFAPRANVMWLQHVQFPKQKRPPSGGLFDTPIWEDIGAGEAIRTPDPNLGKVMLYP